MSLHIELRISEALKDLHTSQGAAAEKKIQPSLGVMNSSDWTEQNYK